MPARFDLRTTLIALSGTILFQLLAIGAWGNAASFFADPVRLAVVVFSLLAAASIGFSGISAFSSGQSELKSNRWIFIPFILLAVAVGWLPPYCDRHDWFTLDGDVVRYAGLVLYVLGGLLRVATVFVLGHRFSALVARQQNHELETGSVYRFVRHPSYLAVLVALIGWSLVFRSSLGLALTALIALSLIGRIRAEEAFLEQEFDGPYLAYKEQVRWRLLPGVY